MIFKQVGNCFILHKLVENLNKWDTVIHAQDSLSGIKTWIWQACSFTSKQTRNTTNTNGPITDSMPSFTRGLPSNNKRLTNQQTSFSLWWNFSLSLLWPPSMEGDSSSLRSRSFSLSQIFCLDCACVRMKKAIHQINGPRIDPWGTTLSTFYVSGQHLVSWFFLFSKSFDWNIHNEEKRRHKINGPCGFLVFLKGGQPKISCSCCCYCKFFAWLCILCCMTHKCLI